ncbi:unnamed protein product [Rotaria sordida]|uniref:Poly [ADP-ribose] polymerase n=1 Tax=Rotaria sordida TaxID=392033 RepID=A0A819EI29_9BILA|nr:unnamed protein product [Rotaria sordida]
MASQIEKLKSKANDTFSEENYDEAINLYTQAIALDGNNHYLYSNRSAAYIKAYKYKEALKDAEQCLKLKSDFVKGYSRKGAALLLLKRYKEAINTYEEGLKIDPNNEVLFNDLETARKAATKGSKTDVIVVCSSSKFLFEKICEAGGKSVLASYKSQFKKSPNSVISVQADGELASKKIYFLSWTADADTSILRESIEKFVSDAFEKAVEENQQSIAFPAIGCGQFGCSIDLVAQTMIREAHRKQQEHDISVTFVIQPERTDIYDEFQNQIQLLEAEISPTNLKTMSATVKKGVIEIEQGNIIKQKVDVIIGTSSSVFLRQAITEAAGSEVEKAYKKELKSHPNSTLIAVSSGALSCKQIFFVQWEPNDDEEILRQSIIDLISTVVQNMISHKFTSVAFPAIGCGLHGCSTQIDTEKRLYHGCPEQAASLIMEDCFNRSFAGVNGTVYGFGVYFSSNASYSHGYTRPNSNGERCMFMARVLVGKTTKGNSSMKTRPLGFDSTTDEKHIFVTYHDAQAFAEYLITYK